MNRIILSILIGLIGFCSCKSTKPANTQGIFKVAVYDRGKEHIEGVKFMSFGKYFSPIIRKYTKKSKVRLTHEGTVTNFLKEFLSVNNKGWYEKIFYKGRVFWPADVEVFIGRNLGHKESFEVLKYLGIVYDATSYDLLKLKHINFDGQEEILEMILMYDNKTERFYLIETIEDPELAKIAALSIEYNFN